MFANAAVILLFLFAGMKMPRLYFFWILIAAAIPEILATILHIYITVGVIFHITQHQSNLFRDLYYISLALSPIELILYVGGTYMMTKHIIKREAQQGATANASRR